MDNVLIAFNKANISLVKLSKLFDRLVVIKNAMQEESSNRSINPLTWFDSILNKSVEHSNIFLALFSAHQDIANSSPSQSDPNQSINSNLTKTQQDQTVEQPSQSNEQETKQQSNEVSLSDKTVSLLLSEIQKIDRPSKTAVGIFAAIGSLGIILLIALIITFTRSVKRNSNKEKI